MAFCGIYQIKNTVNGKKYIGKSIDIERRLKRHLRCLRNECDENDHFINSFKKYREDNFKASIIAICDEKDLNTFEQWFINIEGCSNERYGYNKTFGGDGWGNGIKHSDKTKIKMSKSRNSSGFRNVSKHHNGWRFSFYSKRKYREIHAYTLLELKSKVEKKGFKWEIIDKEKAKKSRELDDKKTFKNAMKNSTGFFRVNRVGNSWRYRYYQNGQRTSINSQSIDELESKVRALNLEWGIIDDNKAQKSLELDKTR